MQKVLKQVPLFSMLGEKGLSYLSDIAEKHTYEKNVIVFHKGDPGNALIVLLSGKLRIFLSHEDGREITLSYLKPYDYLGEISILDDSPRSASVQAVERSQVYTIHKERFRDLLAKHPAIAFTMLQEMSSIVRRLTEEVDSLSFHDVYGRVARKICSLMETNGTQTSKGVEVRHELTHQDLANMVGSARESVTKVLNNMEADGILCVDRHCILVVKPEKLKTLHDGTKTCAHY